ncbi:transcriptional regulator [Anaerosporomusa subterranea]|uniref:Probable transcriptional regulatory protein AXX12_05610 n=1 Tax=Anaerosporomusa subterranea TaxID=1794912 RepID=A0A154BUH9_ANASB|nr:YebC/PmpR family DNA-binding transcriptional regulator [Anaerosporomusa subterranea]KYZ77582.1 transcriptional regulator [Anaerosporomusa subterranea]
MSGHSKWANIKHKKGRMDALRGKVTTKISREITIAVKNGGADATGNMRLKLALQKARENNIPKENIQRAIQKGQGSLEGSNYEEFMYEGYGPAGVAVMLDILTDNRNRTAADIRHLFSKNNGNLGESGCVSWMFTKKGIIIVEKDGVDEESLMMLALDSGADDFSADGDVYEILTDPDQFEAVQQALDAAKITVASAQLSMVPQTTVSLADEDATKVTKLLEALEEHDDVQEVYTNADLPDEEEED